MNMQVVLAIKLFNSTSHISVVNTEHLAGDDDVESSLKLQGAGCKGRHIFFYSLCRNCLVKWDFSYVLDLINEFFLFRC